MPKTGQQFDKLQDFPGEVVDRGSAEIIQLRHYLSEDEPRAAPGLGARSLSQAEKTKAYVEYLEEVSDQLNWILSTLKKRHTELYSEKYGTPIAKITPFTVKKILEINNLISSLKICDAEWEGRILAENDREIEMLREHVFRNIKTFYYIVSKLYNSIRGDMDNKETENKEQISSRIHERPKRINVSLTPSVRNLFETTASSKNMSLTEFLRRAGFAAIEDPALLSRPAVEKAEADYKRALGASRWTRERT